MFLLQFFSSSTSSLPLFTFRSDILCLLFLKLSALCVQISSCEFQKEIIPNQASIHFLKPHSSRREDVVLINNLSQTSS
ncbi:hypothetical protein K1719_016702 [Acacia pycnantha]|nr:hypothetical protein K1719_016702 [Acacia pycnantha]